MEMNERPRVEVNSPEEIPVFASEDAEHEFWKTHSLGPGMFDGAEPDPDLPLPRTRPTSLRLDNDTVRRLRTLARRKGTGYQTLLRTFVTERLYEEEKREGLVGR